MLLFQVMTCNTILIAMFPLLLHFKVTFQIHPKFSRKLSISKKRGGMKDLHTALPPCWISEYQI